MHNSNLFVLEPVLSDDAYTGNDDDVLYYYKYSYYPLEDLIW